MAYTLSHCFKDWEVGVGETSQGYVHTLQPLLCTAQFCFVGTLLFICLQYRIPVLTDHACTKKQSRTHITLSYGHKRDTTVVNGPRERTAL